MSVARTPMTDALREIQAPVREQLSGLNEEMIRIVSSDLPTIEAVSRHLLSRTGKMFRPTLALLSAAAEGGVPNERAITLAAVVELMHLATLVHDDSVDHSVVRRGLPTINALFSHQVSVIMGDFLYTRALVALIGLGDLELTRILANVANQLTIGEVRQLAAVDALSFTEDDYHELIKAKTAVLIAGACETGALIGAPRHAPAMRLYGERLGLAFQIADDILDYVEDTAVTGKPSGNDLREHKVTLPLIAALPRLTPAQRKKVDELFANEKPGDELIAEVVSVVIEAGGIEYARRRGEELAQEAEAALAGLPDTPARAALSDAITYVMDRRW